MTIVAIFAHPDDEAFGPAGTIYKLAQENQVYLLCATKGEAGENHSGRDHKRMDEVRANELKASAKILGVKEVFFLGFKDGTLSNSLYHDLAAKIEEKLEKLRPEMLLTYEPRGVSGHVDHIVVSLVTTFVFYRLPFVKTLWQYCISEKQSQWMDDYFIYFPPGYKESEIDKVVDVEPVWEKKRAAMLAHESQKKDALKILKRYEKLPKKEHFLVMKKM